MNWIRELNVGDQFLDSTRTIVGVVLFKDEGGMKWKWRGLAPSSYHTFKDLEKNPAVGNWTKVTPLLKELL